MKPTQSNPAKTAGDDQGKPSGGQGAELSEQQLEQVSGGVIRRVFGGDDDLEDLEVERLR